MAESPVGSSDGSEAYWLASTRPCGLSTLLGARLWLNLIRLPCFRHGVPRCGVFLLVCLLSLLDREEGLGET
ncbi:hypothetical protein Taro_045773 [Colocasia esculenta]|uniref:Uncharacterized protein n=1 Tax=Colocasia esculenta TaxID=4460 RepID=A0A843WN22_COLES|nr:hypothetical protein [Colocasia esculenta]